MHRQQEEGGGGAAAPVTPDKTVLDGWKVSATSVS